MHVERSSAQGDVYGCRMILIAEDAIPNADNRRRLITYTETHSLGVFTKALPHQHVRLLVDERVSAKVSTEPMGRASRIMGKGTASLSIDDLAAITQVETVAIDEIKYGVSKPPMNSLLTCTYSIGNVWQFPDSRYSQIQS